jgi:hypothetical protein
MDNKKKKTFNKTEGTRKGSYTNGPNSTSHVKIPFPF